LVRATALAPLLFKPALPVKLLLPFVKVITPAPALIVAAPALAACVILPVCVIPTPVKLSVPVPTDEVPMLNAPLLVTDTLFAPLFESETAPVKTFALFNVIALPPTVKLDAPGTVRIPVWVIAPLEVIDRFCPTVEAAKTVAMLFVKATALAPLLDKVIAPVNAFALFKVIALLPALKLDVPGTVRIPVCVIAPFDITARF
jgi:hypothetical protein